MAKYYFEVQIGHSMLSIGCYEVRKEANHWTVYGSAERTGIKANHKKLPSAQFLPMYVPSPGKKCLHAYHLLSITGSRA